MGVAALLASIEQDTWLMSLDVTKVRGRHSQCTLISQHSPHVIGALSYY